MAFTLTEKCFSSEDEAVSAIKARGWHPVPFAVAAETIDWHWHDFDAVLYIVSGSIDVEPEGGPALSCGPWSRLDAPANVVHRESTNGYRVVFGLCVHPGELTQPINKLVAQPV